MNRCELLGYMTEYLEALLANAPERLPVSETLKVTFNGEVSELGKNNIWRRTRIFPQRQTFADPNSGNVVFFGTATNEVRGTGPAKNLDWLSGFFKLFVVRLHVVRGGIDEVEEMCVDSKIASFPSDLKDVKLPEYLFEFPVPTEERVGREDMIRIVNSYWESVARTGEVSDMPVHPDAIRLENGSRCTDNTCSFLQDFSRDTFRWNTPESERFFYVMDEARQVAVSFQVFSREPYASAEPSDAKGFYACEVFKIDAGRIRSIMAFWRPYQLRSGWAAASV